MLKPKLRLLLVIGMLLIGALVTFIPHTSAYANYSAPSWWNGYQCDSNYNPGSAPLQYNGADAQWNGIVACGPEPGTGLGTLVYFFPGAWGEYEWQCTELVTRYLYIAYGAPPISATGDQIVANYANTYPGLFRSITNDGNTHVFPKIGDVLSYSTVHTAIVTGVNVTDPINGNATLTLLEQNASTTGVANQTVTGWVIKHGVDDGGSTDTVTAWLTPKAWTDISPAQQSGVNTTHITSVAAQNTSTVWEAGNYLVPNGAYNPLIEKYNGSSWTVYKPAPPVYSYPSYLTGVATDASGNAYAVGWYQDYNYVRFTEAFRWNGGTNTWDRKTSDNPNNPGQNVLYGVAVDGNGTGWAVGYYGDTSGGNSPGHPLPLLEKWDGTKFTKQTISLPTDATYAILNGISFDSATDGWLVGQAYYSAQAKWAYVIYHYDGSNWTVQATVDPPSVTSNLVSVTAVSSSEAWAVGLSGGNTLVMHYTSSTWNVVGNLPLPSISTTLTSIANDGSNEVWAVGYWYGQNQYGYYYNQPFSMRWGGNSWVSFTTPYAGGNEYLNGVAVTANHAWAGGSQTPINTNYSNPIVYTIG